jgi:PPM family protein phosphatase
MERQRAKRSSPFAREWRLPLRPGRRVATAPDAAGLSRRGSARPVDQDRYLADGAVFAVADGVGGRTGGERAAELVMQEAARLAHEVERAGARGPQPLAAIPPQCQALLRDEAARQPGLAGMATTLTLALVVWPDAHLVHAGDSRCYLCRNGGLIRLTDDQTMAAELQAAGALSESDAERSPLKRVLASSISSGSTDVRPAARRLRLQAGDTLLLCTDGLYEVVPEEDLARLVRQGQTAAGICRELLEAAQSAGAEDDTTAVVARWT